MPEASYGRYTWQRVWETRVSTVVQNDPETVTKHYVVDYLSVANRDILVTEDGSYIQRYVYDSSGDRKIAEFSYAEGTLRGEQGVSVGEPGENLSSDFAAAEIQVITYRSNLTNTSLIAVDTDGEVISHMTYDPWGVPETTPRLDENYAGIDNLNNFTGYTYDDVLEIYYAQFRFYSPTDHRFIQEDPIKGGFNRYTYCGNNPLIYVDMWGLVATTTIDNTTYVNLNIFTSEAGGWKSSNYSTSSTSYYIRDNYSEGVTITTSGTSAAMYGYAYGSNVFIGQVGMKDGDYVSQENLYLLFERMWCIQYKSDYLEHYRKSDYVFYFSMENMGYAESEAMVLYYVVHRYSTDTATKMIINLGLAKDEDYAELVTDWSVHLAEKDISIMEVSMLEVAQAMQNGGYSQILQAYANTIVNGMLYGPDFDPAIAFSDDSALDFLEKNGYLSAVQKAQIAAKWANWGNPDTLSDHYSRHGSDFNATSIVDYANQATQFYNSRESYQVKIDSDGVARVYDSTTNTFGSYNADGTTRTFFKPTSGQRYFNNQSGVIQ